MTDMSQFKDIFIMEAEEHIQKINDNILAVEKIYEDPSKNDELTGLLNELMRSSHTIKGSSASMGYVKLAFLTHVMEDIFDNTRNNEIKLSSEIINRIFEAIDSIESSVSSIKSNDAEIDTDVLANKLKEISGVQTTGIGKSNRNKQSGTDGEITPVVDEATTSAKSVSTEDVLSASVVDETVIEAAKISYIKVPVERLDVLMDMVEELLIDKMRLEQLATSNPALKEISDHVNLLISGIQFQVMQARLVPVEQVFARFPRTVRDLAQKEGKKIEFKMIGSEIELDRTIVDKLGEPLIHLIRNAVDHGIRKEGNITVSAVRESDAALFIVENDDQNIDYEKVRSSAVKRGIVSAQDAPALQENDLTELLFHPRLSTRDVVTEISGRGVGLSVVKKFVNEMGGKVTVDNLNPGVRFTLHLPLTLAIINALLVEMSGRIFAIPFTNIERSVKINVGEIKEMADKEVAIVDDTNLPLVRFANVLKAGDLHHLVPGFAQADKQIDSVLSKKDVIAVIISGDNERAGLVVDKLISVQEIIVKPLSPVLRGVKGFSGSTILGDGQAVLILDAINIIR